MFSFSYKVWKKLLETARAAPDHRGKIVQPEAYVESMQLEREKGSATLRKNLQNGSDKTIQDLTKGEQNAK